ncbi:MAG: asparagine synthase (glutamine-hydrolyzing), partial [Verrucomicrobiota bacterium]
MCAIAAVLGNTEVEPMQRALDTMQHRGPDSAGVWAAGNEAILGHRRLAVRGAPNDAQPIVSERGDIAIAVNGEFYNADQIRKNLENRGHVFRTTSDSEIALHLFEECGFDCVQQLRGEFAFVIWDGPNQRLVVFRDRFGVKPVCYANRGDSWMIASEAKAIFASGFASAAWDLDSVQHSLAHQYLPPDRTMFEGIKMVPPAHFAIFQNQKPPILQRYWTPEFAEEAVDPEEIFRQLRESVVDRLDANIPPAFSLSGGIDSSAVVAIASNSVGRKVPAFSVSFFDGEGYDEFQSVRDAADDLGAELTPVPVSRESMVLELENAVAFSEGLAINGQLVGKFLLSRAIHQARHNVVLSGEGADEAFLGYAHLQMDSGIESSQSFGKQAGVMLPTGDGPSFSAPSWLGNWPSFLKAKLKFAERYQQLLTHEFDQEKYVNSWLKQLCAEGETTFPKKAAWLWSRSALSSYILRTLADGTEMAHSVEGRVPFLDHQL